MSNPTDKAATKTVPTTVLNIAPMKSPINPYEFGFRYLKASQQDTDTPEVKAKIEERKSYMRWLVAKLPALETNEPIICLALMRAALDVKARAFLVAALEVQVEQIPKLVEAANAKRRAAAPAVKPDEVITRPAASPPDSETEALKRRIAELEGKLGHPTPSASEPPAAPSPPSTNGVEAPK